MAILSQLPDEALEKIFEFVTSDRESLENVSLVNSRFNKIVFPLLVRQWNNSQECAEPCIERLALHLLRNPDLRKHVKRLDLGYLRLLASIETLCTYGLFDDLDKESLAHLDDYMLPFPVGTSTITELNIVGCLRAGLPDFISACRSLKKLIVRVDYSSGYYGVPDQKELAEAVMKQKDSLEELDLDISLMSFPNPEPVVEETYQHLPRLWSLAVHISDLFDGLWKKKVVDCIKVDLGRIPQDIQVLTPRYPRANDNWVSISNVLYLKPYLEGMIVLLEEAGPRGRFGKLRVLDLSEAFVDDPIMFDIKRVKQLGQSRGVKVLLHD